MKSKKLFEIWRWLYFFLFWFITTVIITLIVQIVAVPVILWLFNDMPYVLPGWYRIGRLALVSLFIGFFAGTVSWYYEKRSNGR